MKLVGEAPSRHTETPPAPHCPPHVHFLNHCSSQKMKCGETLLSRHKKDEKGKLDKQAAMGGRAQDAAQPPTLQPEGTTAHSLDAAVRRKRLLCSEGFSRSHSPWGSEREHQGALSGWSAL